MTDQVTKRPYDISAAYKVLIYKTTASIVCYTNICLFKFGFEEFANKMALRTGGLSELRN
jgi:hypothetical protein